MIAAIQFEDTRTNGWIETTAIWEGPADGEVLFSRQLLETCPGAIENMPWKLVEVGADEVTDIVRFRAADPDLIKVGVKVDCPKMRRPLTPIVMEY